MAEEHMAEEQVNAGEDLSQNQLEEEYIKSMQPLEEGQILTGTIIQMNSEFIFIDVGYKSEGKIPIEEFEEKPQIGDSVEVVLLKKEGKEGSIVVSKQKADEKIFWKNLKKNFYDNVPVEGEIIGKRKGGFDVALSKSIMAFLPFSKVDIHRINDEDAEKYLNKKSFFKIERLFTNGKVNIVLSRKSYLENENKKKRKTFFENTQIGDEVTGVVKSFTSFGAFIDLGGFDGLLHINDMSWGHLSSPKEIIKLGQEIKLKIIRLSPEENRINLSLKHFKDDPWTLFESQYHNNDIVKGVVTKLTNFGAFVELEEGIEGLVHISELSWVKKIKHPKEILKVGDEIEVMILNYDITKGKVSLGLKQVLPNPWDNIEETYPVGMRLKRKVKKLINFGAFIELEEGIDGLLHIDDLSWTKKYKHPSELLEEGQEIEIMIIGVDKKNKKIKLSIKQLTENPWKSLKKAYPKGSIIEGEIKNVTDFGIFVTVQSDIEGLIPKNSICDPETEKYEEVIEKYKVGEKIKTLVMEINSSKQKLTLSRRNYLISLHKEEMSKYIHDDSTDEKVTLGDILKDRK